MVLQPADVHLRLRDSEKRYSSLILPSTRTDDARRVESLDADLADFNADDEFQISQI